MSRNAEFGVRASGSSGPEPFGSGDPFGQPAGTPGPVSLTAPTWRDLPYEPPYGPVPPPKTPNIGNRVDAEVVAPEDDASVSAKQIALAIGGVLLLVALGIAAALLLLDDENDALAQDDPPQSQSQAPPPPPPLQPSTAPDQPGQQDQGQQDQDEQNQDEHEQGQPGQDEPEPNNPGPAPDDGPAGEQAPEGSEPGDDPTEEAPSGSQDPGSQDPGAQEPGNQEPGSQEPGAQDQPPEPGEEGQEEQSTPPSGEQGQPPQDQPGGVPPPDTPPQDQPDIDLPRLFELRRLPSGTAESTTTVRQTSGDDTDPVTEQTTILDTDDGEEYSVVATRSDDAAERYEQLRGDATEELSVSGEDAILTTDGDLAYLIPGEVDTLIVIDGPESAGLDQLVVVAQGLELLQ